MRTNLDRWNTLWADGWVFDYGPSGYLGFPQIHHLQAWISPPARSLVLRGEAGAQPEQAWLGRDGEIFRLDLESDLAFLEDIRPGLSLPDNFALEPLLIQGALVTGWEIAAIDGLEPVAGRSALRVDWRLPGGAGQARTWVDTQSGVILRALIQELDGQGRLSTRVLDIANIEFDIDFPPVFFEPQLAPRHFSRDYRGEILSAAQLFHLPQIDWPQDHLARAQVSPPEGFDPSQATLFFEWDFPPASRGASFVSVFADEFYLGRVLGLDPWRGACTRSPDGQILAFNTSAVNPGELFWVNLDDLENWQEPENPLTEVEFFSFSPDGRQLAVSACQAGSNCGLYLSDINDGELKLLSADLRGVTSLAWSPDGQFLAAVAPWGRQRFVWVFEAATGSGAYWQPMTPGSGGLPADSPTRAWGVEFPRPMSGIEGCT